MHDEHEPQPTPATWPSPAIHSLPPETKRRYQEMHDALSYYPPVRRNWTPIVYAAAAAAVGGTIWAILAVLA